MKLDHMPRIVLKHLQQVGLHLLVVKSHSPCCFLRSLILLFQKAYKLHTDSMMLLTKTNPYCNHRNMCMVSTYCFYLFIQLATSSIDVFSVAGSSKKPEDMYRIIEHFALGRRRLELFGEDHNIRPGWLTLGKNLSYSNFNKEVDSWTYNLMCRYLKHTHLQSISSPDPFKSSLLPISLAGVH